MVIHNDVVSCCLLLKSFEEKDTLRRGLPPMYPVLLRHDVNSFANLQPMPNANNFPQPLLPQFLLLLQALRAPMPSSLAKEHPLEYIAASGLAAAVNYPLWRASAVGQSGFVLPKDSWMHALRPTLWPYVYALQPPYKGIASTVLGMTWARAAIFWGSDAGKEWLLGHQVPTSVATVLPPLVVSTLVQCVNMPIVRATITIQNPESNIPNVPASIRHIYRTHGLSGLWHGTSAGILKTVPKYCTAVVVKDLMEESLPRPDPVTSENYHELVLWRSAAKSAAAGVAGAALTNPLDVIRNEMFKTNLGLVETVKHLVDTEGSNFVIRGLGKNLVAVSIPVACTIFFTDALIDYTTRQ